MIFLGGKASWSVCLFFKDTKTTEVVWFEKQLSFLYRIAFPDLSPKDHISCQKLLNRGIFFRDSFFLRCALEAKMAHVGVRYFQLCQNAVLELLAGKNGVPVSFE